MTDGWIKELRVGDVVRSGSGTLRTVRAVKHYKRRTNVTFSILHCSWTGRCYTVMTDCDLRTFGYRPTGQRKRLRSRLDRAVARDFGKPKDRTRLSCCDVRGIS